MASCRSPCLASPVAVASWSVPNISPHISPRVSHGVLPLWSTLHPTPHTQWAEPCQGVVISVLLLSPWAAASWHGGYLRPSVVIGPVHQHTGPSSPTSLPLDEWDQDLWIDKFAIKCKTKLIIIKTEMRTVMVD